MQLWGIVWQRAANAPSHSWSKCFHVGWWVMRAGGCGREKRGWEKRERARGGGRGRARRRKPRRDICASEPTGWTSERERLDTWWMKSKSIVHHLIMKNVENMAAFQYIPPTFQHLRRFPWTLRPQFWTYYQNSDPRSKFNLIIFWFNLRRVPLSDSHMWLQTSSGFPVKQRKDNENLSLWFQNCLFHVCTHVGGDRGVKIRPLAHEKRPAVCFGCRCFPLKNKWNVPRTESWPRMLSSRSRSIPKMRSWRCRQGAKAALLHSLQLLWAQHVSFTRVLIQNCVTFTFCWVEEKTRVVDTKYQVLQTKHKKEVYTKRLLFLFFLLKTILQLCNYWFYF